MKKVIFEEALKHILEQDTRYKEDAYYFLREALDFTIQLLSKPSEGPARHVSGRELLDGVRQFALQEFGAMAKTVLCNWGIERCEDIGEIVFNLVESGILGKNDRDKKEDFENGFDFDEAFLKPFEATPKKSPAVKTGRKRTE